MNVFRHFTDIVRAVARDLAETHVLPTGLDLARVSVEPPREASHGDLSTNAAMVLAREAKLAPRALADLFAAKLRARPEVVEISVAGPGFINLRLADEFWRGQVPEILHAGTSYGDSDIGARQPVNIEYVSANPTGPMHVGHGRGAVFGDALADLLEKAGFAVTREYYINDAGAQVDQLARSVHLRYREALGEPVGPPGEGLYPGEYLIPVGRMLAQTLGGKWQNAPEEEWLKPAREAAIEAMLAMIRDDLAALGVRHQVFSSERTLVESGAIDRALAELEAGGHIYVGVLEPPKGKPIEDWEPRPQTLFRATGFGDDVDRPLRKSDGSWTYFASDIAYHLDKYRRGFGRMIDVWGADHGGYVKRVQAAVKALTGGRGVLDVKICQLVRLMRAGEQVKMSKRSGTFVSLREVIDEVGKDAVRFIMLTRKNDAVLDFDFAKVTEQSRDNPVFYVQYAHARAASVMRHARVALADESLDDLSLAGAPFARLGDQEELALIKALAGWPRIIESAAEAHEPHRIAFYLYDLAAAFHALWNKGKDNAELRFLIAGDRELTLARLGLVRAVALVIASGLAVMGVEPVQEMR
jgi:arginyl-tRNA synthetase